MADLITGQSAEKWLGRLKFDPLGPLLRSESQPIRYFASRDLTSQAPESEDLRALWELDEPRRILEKQLENGAWRYHGGSARIRSADDYNQLETYRVLGQLIEKYGLDRSHSAVQSAAAYLFARQTDEGDFRGIYGSQYTPNYSAAITELLMEAGYHNDAHVRKSFQWLLSVRQEDGGWAIPLRTRRTALDAKALHGPLVASDISKPSSHMVTGVVLRAFAAHPAYRSSAAAKNAGRLLVSRFFSADKYPDRGTPVYWTYFTFPFWFTDIISALDSVSRLGFTTEGNPEISRALDWLIRRQETTGTWRLTLRAMAGEKHRDLWISLAACKVLRRFLS
jgi:hypothetical protein